MQNNNYRFISPEYAALINPNACAAYAMRCEGRADVKQRTVVATGTTPGSVLGKTSILSHTTKSQVCDAQMFVMPFVEVYNDLTLDYASQFVTTLLNFDIDGEPVIKNSAINNHLLCPACLIARQPTDEVRILLGCDCELGLLGMCQMFFLPNGTEINASLDNIPTGGGDLNVVAGVILVNYTTKVRQGCLFSVGALDAAQQAYPVNYPCQPSFSAPSEGGGAPMSGPAAGPAFGPANLG
jgi:hypothetical protein